MTPSVKTAVVLGSLLALLALAGLLYSARGWLRGALSETDGAPSSSRLIAFLWAVALIPAFLAWGSWEAYSTSRLPDVAGWGTFLGFAQGAGALPYLANQLRRGLSEAKTTAQAAPG
jgi:hypothetical protein